MMELKKLLKHLFKKIGFEVVKIKPGSDRGRIIAWEKIITVEEARSANSSVGKDNGKAFTYFPRPNRTTAEMDKLENRWWNSAGHLIEKIWVLSDDICLGYREHYVKKAAKYFQKDNKHPKILDLGCGSGWMGRMIVNEDIEYIGIDFSETQIQIAEDKISGHPFREKIKFFCLDDFKSVPGFDQINCVVINAFLHHLYWEELENLFQSLTNSLQKDCKFFILEPIYPSTKSHFDEVIGRDRLGLVRNNFRSLLADLREGLISENQYDTDLESQVEMLIDESNRNAFFFSPKEVPFRFDEFISFLSKYLVVENHFVTGVLDLELSQFLAKVKDGEIRQKITPYLFGQVRLIDDFLLSNNYTSHFPNDYLFTAFECRLRKA